MSDLEVPAGLVDLLDPDPEAVPFREFCQHRSDVSGPVHAG
ncbi:hypothetical protein [Saccharopolyspora karakumensis]|nr:hypothetical protein [Saccharopolyspora karakumensis]